MGALLPVITAGHVGALAESAGFEVASRTRAHGGPDVLLHVAEAACRPAGRRPGTAANGPAAGRGRSPLGRNRSRPPTAGARARSSKLSVWAHVTRRRAPGRTRAVAPPDAGRGQSGRPQRHRRGGPQRRRQPREDRAGRRCRQRDGLAGSPDSWQQHRTASTSGSSGSGRVAWLPAEGCTESGSEDRFFSPRGLSVFRHARPSPRRTFQPP